MRPTTKLTKPLSVDQRIDVSFRGATIPALKSGDETYIPIAMICTDLGLTTTVQLRALNRRQPFAKGVTYLSVMYPDGQRRKAACLLLGLFADWLKSINTSELRSDHQAQIRSYQRYAAGAVYAALNDRPRS